MKSNISIIISILCISTQIFPQEDIKVISSDFNSIIIEYTALYDTLKEKLNNQEYLRIDLANGYVPDEQKWGEALVPERSINIGVPSEYGNTIEVLNSSYKEINGKLLPKGKPKIDKGMLVEEYIVGENYSNYLSSEELVSFGEFEIIRGIPTHRFLIRPVKFYPMQSKILLYGKIVFRINFPSNRIVNLQKEDEFLKGSIPNYDVAKYWIKEERRREVKKITTSVLSTGKWVKFETHEEGM